MSRRVKDKEYKINAEAVGSAGSLYSVLRNKVELLSPAGNMECLYAAVNAGCDACYAAGDRFGARAYAGNFSREEFIEAIGYMHLFGRKIYLTLNTLIKPKEYEELYEYVKPFYVEGLDGVIVQDLGVISFLLKTFPDMEVHASTQMSVSSLYGASLLKDMGVKRIVPSRELSLNEIKEIYEETGLDLECFIHGAMCYSYSGMCLMSSFLGGRSGNRGRCAGPCRQPYTVKGSVKNKYLLSMKDMCTIDIMDELISAGIRSFKIEGRMKSPEYVFGVTKIYRKYIDRALKRSEGTYKVEGSDRNRLVNLYSRGGISTGYYHRHNGLDMITTEKGSYKREDTEKIRLNKKQIPLKLHFTAKVDNVITLEVKTMDEKHGTVSVGQKAQSAKNRPMLKEDMEKQLIKTGGSDFYFKEISIDTDGACFIPVSAVNDLRRDAIDNLRKEMLDEYKRSL